jgi:hypothetical protein
VGRERRGKSGAGRHVTGEEAGAGDGVGEGVQHRHDARTGEAGNDQCGTAT